MDVSKFNVYSPAQTNVGHAKVQAAQTNGAKLQFGGSIDTFSKRDKPANHKAIWVSKDHCSG